MPDAPPRSLAGQKIAVIGGGLGGLCAALAFEKRGASVTVYEAAPVFGEVGAGIQVSANGLRVLENIGIDASGGVLSQGLTLNDHFGRRVAILPNPERREVRLFHRADLLALLEEAVRARGIDIELDARVSPDAAPDADLIIAADGVKSAFRASVAPDLSQPMFTRQSAWRALVPLDAPVGEAGVNVYMGPGRHMVIYPLRGGQYLNIFAGEDTGEPLAEGWQQEVAPELMQARFADFGGPVPAMLARITRVHRWGLYDHALPRRWSLGNVVLLGDAAHAMLPYLAQGACMAFEDAWELAGAWATYPDPDEALGAYERRRAPRVARVMKEVKANATRFHHGNPVARVIGHGALRLASTLAPGLIAARFNWLYDWKPGA